jgi:spoIIIJ-associated protein
MTDLVEKSERFVGELLAGLGLKITPAARWSDEGCHIDLSGVDSHLARAENGELLDALEVILFQAFGRELERHQRFLVDAEGYRERRRAELEAMAQFAADKVRASGQPFVFGILNSTERRMIHLALKEQTDLVTESVGEGRQRRLQVRLK